MDKNEFVFDKVYSFVKSKKDWSGTMTSLHSEISKNSKKELMPKNACEMRKTINKIVYKLRSKGISVKFKRSKERLVTFKISK